MLNRKLRQRIYAIEEESIRNDDMIYSLKNDNDLLKTEIGRLSKVIDILREEIHKIKTPAKYKVGFDFIKDNDKCIIISIDYKYGESQFLKEWKYEYFNGRQKLTILEHELDKLLKKQ